MSGFIGGYGGGGSGSQFPNPVFASQAFGLRGSSYTTLYNNNIITVEALQLGGRDGPGGALLSGTLAICDYILPLSVADGSQLSCDAGGYVWMNNANGSALAYQIFSRSGLVYINPPAITGTAPTNATSVGGTIGHTLVLPIYNSSNGACIVVDQ